MEYDCNPSAICVKRVDGAPGESASPVQSNASGAPAGCAAAGSASRNEAGAWIVAIAALLFARRRRERCATAIAGALVIGCTHAPPRMPAIPEPYAPIALDPPPPIDAITWIGSAGEARARAADEGKPLLVFVRASWSEASVVMDQTIWRDARVLREAPRFVALRIDVTDLTMKRVPEDLARDYGIETIPTSVVVNTDGTIAARFGAGVARAADVADAMHRAK